MVAKVWPGREGEKDQDDMRRREEEGVVSWEWRTGDWMLVERVEWRWRMGGVREETTESSGRDKDRRHRGGGENGIDFVSVDCH
nr:hypothetical protein Iba_chr07aCG9330 [Ipomoea batatas]GMD14809.1 hypothetical protein Iba_chr07bCG10020 [Ipomoea batatas]